MDFETLRALRAHHPAWRLLRSDHAELIASFLYKAFVTPNLRVISQADLTEALEDHLYALRLLEGPKAYPRTAAEYLGDWSEPEKGWLRKFYRVGTDEPQFDLMPATEKAMSWLEQLGERHFVGTESRLLMLMDLLRQMVEGTEEDPEKRLAELQKKRDAIEAEMDQLRRGELPTLSDTGIRDRFQQFNQMARTLLADFREVEQNFRRLDRQVREKIALWDGSKGALIDEVMGARDAIGDSDQGRSFSAFWEFLLSGRRQEELSALLEHVMGLEAVVALRPDPRLRRVHHDWLEAGEHTQRTVAQLSQQLRRFLDDQAFLENRRIMDLLRGVEAKALMLREQAFPRDFMAMEAASADIELPMERPLFRPSLKVHFDLEQMRLGEADFDAGLLFEQPRVDTVRLNRHIRAQLRTHKNVTLKALVQAQPLKEGLSELVAYLQIGTESYTLEMDPEVSETVRWTAESPEGAPIDREARGPRVTFSP